MNKIIVFDLETQNGLGLDRSFRDVKISVLCAIDETGQSYTYWEDEIANFISELQQARLVVGFNISGFDLPVLQNYTEQNLRKLPIYDILDQFKQIAGHRIKLDDLAKTTLGKGKSGSGLDALKYWSSGLKDKLAQYCLDDVVVTKELFDMILEGKPLRYIDLSSQKEILLPKPQLELEKPNNKQPTMFDL